MWASTYRAEVLYGVSGPEEPAERSPGEKPSWETSAGAGEVRRARIQGPKSRRDDCNRQVGIRWSDGATMWQALYMHSLS